MASLFQMTRFDPGEEENIEEPADENNLKSLNLKIAKRKRVKESKPDDVTAAPESDPKAGDGAAAKAGDGREDPPKKKRKKNKKKKATTAEADGFTVLGDNTDSKKKQVKRVLPYWLSHPDIVDVDLQSAQLLVEDMPGTYGSREKSAKPSNFNISIFSL